MRLEIPPTIPTELSLVSFTLKPVLRIKIYEGCAELEEIPPFDLDPQLELEIFETIKSSICELLAKNS